MPTIKCTERLINEAMILGAWYLSEENVDIPPGQYSGNFNK